jgi:CRISPR-associated protein Cmr3
MTMPEIYKEWLLKPLDTLFFRDGKPFGFGESAYLESIFPPTPQTMQGVVRYNIIRAHCNSNTIFQCKVCSFSDCILPKNIGSSDEGNYGSLDIYGPYLVEDGKRYYHVPLDLMQEAEGQKRLVSLKPSENSADQCDSGNISLPAKPAEYCAIKEVKGWIEENALLEYIREQKLPDKKSLRQDSDFFEKEPRVGIGRDYATHTAKEGMLYSIAPLRFNKDTAIGVKVGGIDESLQPKHNCTKFGGEGRVCKLEIKDCPDTENQFKFAFADKYIKMLLLQPADFGRWLPPGFEAISQNGSMRWEGSINRVNLQLVSACIGKPQKIGGWDMASGSSKAIKSYVPAGSVYFFKAAAGDVTVLATEGKLGENTAIGFGHYILGRWSDV